MANGAQGADIAPINIGSNAEPTTREQIVEAALECFAECGFDGAKSRAIAERAGVNVGLIKYYFDGKLPLWHEAVDRAFSRLRVTMDGALADLVDLSPEDRIRVLLRRFTRFIAANPQFARLMNDEGKRDSERMRWIVDRHLRPIYAQITPLVESLQADGSIYAGAEPFHFMYLLGGAMSLLFHQAPECHYLTGQDPTHPDSIDAQIELVLNLAFGARSDAT